MGKDLFLIYLLILIFLFSILYIGIRVRREYWATRNGGPDRSRR